MIVLVQRVSEAAVAVEAPEHRAAIGRGLCVFLAAERGDSSPQAEWVASKLAHLRIFPDAEGKMNLGIRGAGGAILLVSQITLVGDCSRGRRPSFGDAADPSLGRELVDLVAQQLRERFAITVQTGVFGAHMRVSLVNDGPVTLIVRREPTAAD